ncbi:Cleavage and polyadenylation specificity factor subunit [Entamoeba marina]
MSTLLHQTVIHPHGVESCVIDSFIENKKQLVTCIQNCLTMYDITSNGLVIRCCETLEANVVDVGSVNLNGKTLLILLFKEAKISILQYNPSSNSFEIVSLHCFEQPEHRRKEKLTPTTYLPPRMFIDPDARCIILLCYDRMMWVIPLGDISRSSFKIDLEDLDITRITDAVLMEGYILPTIAILHSSMPTWTGRIVNTTPHTTVLTLLSIDPQRIKDESYKGATIVFNYTNLPYNCLVMNQCYPLPGLFIMTSVSLIYISTTSATSFVLPFNSYFIPPAIKRSIIPIFTELPMQTKIIQPVSSFHKVSPRLYLIFTSNAECFYAHLLVTAGCATEISLSKAPYKFVPTKLLFTNDYLFVASITHDSLLFNYNVVDYGTGDDHGMTTHTVQDVRINSLKVTQTEHDDGYPFDVLHTQLSAQELSIHLPEIDSIFTLSRVNDYSLSNIDGKIPEIFLCCGFQPYGKVIKLQRSIFPQSIDECTYPNKLLDNKDVTITNELETEQQTFYIISIKNQSILKKYTEVDSCSIYKLDTESNQRMDVVLRNGKIEMNEKWLCSIGEKYIKWMDLNSDESNSDISNHVIQFECIQIIPNCIDFLIFTSNGELCYYRSLSDNSFERIRLESPYLFDVSMKLRIYHHPTETTPHRLFISGNKPMYINYIHGYPTILPLSFQPIKSYQPINSTECYVQTNDKEYKITFSRTSIIKNYPFPYTQINIQGTPHYVCCSGSKYFVVSSTTTTIDEPDTPPQLPHSSTQQQQLDEPPRLTALPLSSAVFMDKFYLTRVGTSESFEFKKGLYVNSIKIVNLQDNPVKGKTMLFRFENELEYISDVGDNNRAVGSVCDIGGYLAVGAGNELQILQASQSKKWEKKCFSDLSILIRSISYLPLTLKKDDKSETTFLILLSDLYRSVTMLLFQPENDSIIALGRDGRNLHAIDSTFVLTKDFFYILEADTNQNISVLNYLRTETERMSIFEVDATFNLAKNIIRFTRIRMNNSYVYMYITVEGSMGYLTVVEEQTFQALKKINSNMNREPWHFAGTNPEEYRFEKGFGVGYGVRKSSILDGDVLSHFRMLDNEQKKKVCLRNTTIEDVMQILSKAFKHSNFLQDSI